jgi:hypothetical protein
VRSGEKSKGQSTFFSPALVQPFRNPENRNSESLFSLLTAFEKGKLRQYTASYASNMWAIRPAPAGGMNPVLVSGNFAPAIRILGGERLHGPREWFEPAIKAAGTSRTLLGTVVGRHSPAVWRWRASTRVVCKACSATRQSR